MKRSVVLWILLLIPVWASAQNREVIEATSGENLADKVSTHMQYRFPEFMKGIVYYKFASPVEGKLNYNMLLGEMQFVDANDQVLALAYIEDVLMVKIDDKNFYPLNNNEFTEELLSTPKMQLRVRHKGSATSHGKKGAFGITSTTSSIQSYGSIQTEGRAHQLSITDDVLITLSNFYYLVVGNKQILIKNVKTFTKQFPGHKAQIEEFVKSHNTRFNNEADLKAMVEYCSSF